ncbi:hypothetical protein EVA_16151 [gut metagenome]|uniref:AAA+ ATPase domain-containing protein n=1 Tax=gut metagenome TaxID=749906 RepID=J9G1Q7_9ZZZZ
MITEPRTFDRNAKGVKEMLSIKYPTFEFKDEWYDAFGNPEKRGVWIIWGNSGNGKTSFVMQLCKYLCQFGRVAYNSLEEGASLTMQNTLVRFNMMDVNRKFLLIDAEDMDQLDIRLNKRKSPEFVVIDSFQYTGMNFKQYREFRERHRNKLLIFISHADGKLPSGRSAKSVMFNADMKVYVEGFRAFSKGRYIGPKKYFDIWPEEAERYWENKFQP